MRKQKTVNDVRSERDAGFGRLRDYGARPKQVVVQWDLNEEAKKDRIFKLVVDGTEVYLSVDELQKHTRWV